MFVFVTTFKERVFHKIQEPIGTHTTLTHNINEINVYIRTYLYL